MLTLSLHRKLHVLFALLALTVGSAAVAIADVTIDACVAENSISHPFLAADMQSLCGLSSSIGQLLGFSFSGLLIHAIGSAVSFLNSLSYQDYCLINDLIYDKSVMIITVTAYMTVICFHSKIIINLF